MSYRAQWPTDHQFKPWPKERTQRYNGSGEPCDMWFGPCLCGAWHKTDEEHEQAGVTYVNKETVGEDNREPQGQ